MVQSAQDDVPNMFDTLTGMTRRLGTALVLNPCAYTYGFPGGSDSEASTCNAGDLGSILGLARSPGGGHGNPLQYSCLKNLQGQRSLAGYSPWVLASPWPNPRGLSGRGSKLDPKECCQ